MCKNLLKFIRKIEKISENSKIDHCGTPAYILHNIYKNKGYEGYQCDIWSTDIIL